MFEDLFIDRGTIASYHAAPLLEERLGYLSHCAQAGPGRPHCARLQFISLIRLLDLREGDQVSVAQVEAVAGQWSLPGGRRCSLPADPEACQRFLGHAVRWLRFVDKLEDLARRNTPTPTRSPSSQRGCVKSAGGPKTRFAVAAARWIASSIG